jgi:hypothetical protein
MNGYLRQSTASQSRLIGPFITDVSPYIDPATGLTIANTDIKLRANGTTLSNKNSGGGTHQVNGTYSVTWDATDTANVGELFCSVKIAGALSWFGTYVVLEEAVYDALFVASAPGYGVAQTGDSFARIGATGSGLTTLATQASVTTIDGIVDDILVDTAEIGAAGAGLTNINLPNQTMDIVGNITGNLSGSVGSVTGAVGSVTGAVGSLAAQAKADVNAEVVDALNVDTYAEPGQENPPATTTLVKKLGYVYKMLRNKKTQTATTRSLFADDGVTVDQVATDSDDGTTYTKGELGTGA